jgi:transposase
LRQFREKLGMAKPLLWDKQWVKLEPLLPQYSSAGRPWKDNRAVLDVSLWVLKTGPRWRDLPSDFGVSPPPVGGGRDSGM